MSIWKMPILIWKTKKKKKKLIESQIVLLDKYGARNK